MNGLNVLNFINMEGNVVDLECSSNEVSNTPDTTKHKHQTPAAQIVPKKGMSRLFVIFSTVHYHFFCSCYFTHNWTSYWLTS